MKCVRVHFKFSYIKYTGSYNIFKLTAIWLRSEERSYIKLLITKIKNVLFKHITASLIHENDP